jgi:hypothetical protein
MIAKVRLNRDALNFNEYCRRLRSVRCRPVTLTSRVTLQLTLADACLCVMNSRLKSDGDGIWPQ